ncbi:MAG: alpha/beta hydrolase [Burkholderiaceae bacterium]
MSEGDSTAIQRWPIDPVEVLVEGQGEQTILMIHGWPDTLALWDAQVAALSRRYRCARFTLPGFAGTARQAQAWSLNEITALIGRIVEALNPGGPVILLVHDWGALFGYHFIMSHPQRVSRLIGLDIGDAGSADHVRSLGIREKAMVAGYQLWLALAWRLGGALGDRMTRAMARWLRAPGEPATIGARMNYPYDITWFRSHGSYRHVRGLKLPLPVPMLFVYGERKPFMFHSQPWLDSLATQPGCRGRDAGRPLDDGSRRRDAQSCDSRMARTGRITRSCERQPRLTRVRSPCTCGSASNRGSITRNQSGGT